MQDAVSEYALLDMGDGRQLDCFGSYVVDSPFPAAGVGVRDAKAWASADLRFERGAWPGADGSWLAVSDALPEAWQMRHDGLTFELRPTPSGQVGFFAEQREPWQWIWAAVSARGETAGDEPPAVLNLFAYTGGSTLAAAAAGARVTHVDASRPAVAWARRNAELSGLAAAPIRWIVDDTLAFVRREARRGRQYTGVVLDPPSYGHGAHGERWTLDDQLSDLLDACVAVLAPDGFVLLTAHAEGLDPDRLADALQEAIAAEGRTIDHGTIEAAPLILTALSGAFAQAGVVVRLRV